MREIFKILAGKLSTHLHPLLLRLLRQGLLHPLLLLPHLGPLRPPHQHPLPLLHRHRFLRLQHHFRHRLSHSLSFAFWLRRAHPGERKEKPVSTKFEFMAGNYKIYLFKTRHTIYFVCFIQTASGE